MNGRLSLSSQRLTVGFLHFPRGMAINWIPQFYDFWGVKRGRDSDRWIHFLYTIALPMNLSVVMHIGTETEECPPFQWWMTFHCPPLLLCFLSRPCCSLLMFSLKLVSYDDSWLWKALSVLTFSWVIGHCSHLWTITQESWLPLCAPLRCLPYETGNNIIKLIRKGVLEDEWCWRDSQIL